MSFRRLAFVGLLAAVAAVAVAAPANASTIDVRTGYAAVQGTIDVARDSTTWNFVVSKLGGDTCVYAKVTVEVVNYPGHEHVSARICPSDPRRAVDFRGRENYSFTRAARVELCRQVPARPDHCEQVWREPARPW